MGGNTLTVLTRKELRDALRNRWLLADAAALLLLSTALSLLVYLTGAASPVSGFGRTAASLVNVMLLLVPLMGLTLGGLALAGTASGARSNSGSRSRSGPAPTSQRKRSGSVAHWQQQS